MTPQELGARRRELCAQHGPRCYGARPVAQKLGIHPRTLLRWEDGERQVESERLPFWAYVLGAEKHGG